MVPSLFIYQNLFQDKSLFVEHAVCLPTSEQHIESSHLHVGTRKDNLLVQTPPAPSAAFTEQSEHTVRRRLLAAKYPCVLGPPPQPSGAGC